MALGARSGDVVGEVAGRRGRVLAPEPASVVFAILVILGLRATSNTRAGGDIDFPPPTWDPLQLATIVAFSVVVGVAAAFVPARRAARMSPLSALRNGSSGRDAHFFSGAAGSWGGSGRSGL